MVDDDILAVAEAAAVLECPGVEQHSAEFRLRSAIAAAVSHGKPVRQIATVAHMTALEVVDAAEAVAYQDRCEPDAVHSSMVQLA
ncbi:hypothetical protein [Arthrobacter sp. QXT-31]|uniref:hypothetical protein n=1 Tax=Arthrobacter sp. QXT-31 TaxID=1357915 RepID=UPI000971BC02|nr:hypothetical protein [Arthrobacter sp. QXT-31]APX00434.1 hypothetical protein BWQ92_00630 [Arthrobacter sp. QXT-31]